MLSLGTLTVVGVVVAAALVVLLLRFRLQDKLQLIEQKRRGEASLVTRAHFVEGLERIPVVLSLIGEKFCYDNPDLEACLDLPHVEEIEYDDETATGHSVAPGKALRLRSHGHCFEFILDHASSAKWEAALPPHRYDSGQTRQAV
jgi:hypothetical protein